MTEGTERETAYGSGTTGKGRRGNDTGSAKREAEIGLTKGHAQGVGQGHEKDTPASGREIVPERGQSLVTGIFLKVYAGHFMCSSQQNFHTDDK